MAAGGAGTARLDVELVRRGLARSRGRAASLVAQGRVRVAGDVALKASRPVLDTEALEVDDAVETEYVSRAAYKLIGALDGIAALTSEGPRVEGARCLDAGASTGGFTQVLLARGAAGVVAVDVGHGQLAAEVAQDPRVELREGTNIRAVRPQDLDPLADLVVADLSFISLSIVAAGLLGLTAPGGHLLLMVKPQFEVGRDRLGASGVVSSPDLRQEAVRRVGDAVLAAGGTVRGVVPSPLPGPAGNHEYFLWVTPGAEAASGASTGAISLADVIRRAVVDGSAGLVPADGAP